MRFRDGFPAKNGRNFHGNVKDKDLTAEYLNLHRGERNRLKKKRMRENKQWENEIKSC